jgi:hypothetical protein
VRIKQTLSLLVKGALGFSVFTARQAAVVRNSSETIHHRAVARSAIGGSPEQHRKCA